MAATFSCFHGVISKYIFLNKKVWISIKIEISLSDPMMA